MRLLFVSGLLLSLSACGDKVSSTTDSGEISVVDEDGDGFTTADDCDDSDPAINPDADEICDEIDNNCDGDVDSGLGLTIYADNDGDGYGNAGASATSCEIPSGYSDVGGDCNDANAAIHPDADEICNGLDENCDNEADNDAIDAEAYYVDSDSDGVGDSSTEVISCVRPSNYVTKGGDCDDTDGNIFPGNPEACDGIDNDCDKSTTDYGSVAFEETDGTIVNLTEIFDSGNASYPARYYIDRPGTMTFCGGSWKGALIIDADVEIYGQGGAADNVLDAAEEFPAILIESGAQSVYIEGMTFRRGRANLSGLNGYRRSGGGMYCDGRANIEFNDVVIKESEAEAGGAAYLKNCSLTMTDSSMVENTGVFGAAIATDASTITMVDSEISDNASSYYAGAMYLYSQNGNITVNMTDSFIENNSATYYGGIYVYRYSYNVDVTCTATSKGSGAFVGNSDTYYGGAFLYMYSTASFVSNGCDFGETGSSRDNTPNDIYQYSRSGSGYYSFGDNSYFTCSDSYRCQ